MNIQPHLQNDLVKLRPLNTLDFDDLLNIASDPLIWKQHPVKTRSSLKGFREFFEESLASGGALMILETKTDRPIGSSRYKIIDDRKKIIEIGWTFVSRQYWGGTYNKAIKKLMVNHALEKFENVVLYIDKGNIRSQKAVEKIGAVKVPSGSFSMAPEEESGNIAYVISNPISQ